MVDKKVVGIRKDLVIDEGGVKPPPQPEVIALLHSLLQQAINGEIREIGYSAGRTDDEVSFGFAGDQGYNYTLMHSQLQTLCTEYHINVVLPALTGVYPEEYIDE